MLQYGSEGKASTPLNKETNMAIAKVSAKYCEKYVRELANITRRKYILSVGSNRILLSDSVDNSVVVSAYSNAEFAGKILCRIVNAEERSSIPELI